MSKLSILSGVAMQYISTGDAARICSVGVNTIKRWIRQRKLHANLTPGGHWRIPVHAFVSFLKEHDIPVPAHLRHVEPGILIIDDDPAVCSMLADALDAAAFPAEVNCVHDGYTGLVKVGQLQPQLLVLDILMPHINGLELIRRLRLEPDFDHHMRILVVTGARDNRQLMQQLKAAGPDTILFKPVNLQNFVTTVQHLLMGESSPRRRVQSNAGY
jgi:excisionase family DNA binding protein